MCLVSSQGGDVVAVSTEGGTCLCAPVDMGTAYTAKYGCGWAYGKGRRWLPTSVPLPFVKPLLFGARLDAGGVCRLRGG